MNKEIFKKLNEKMPYKWRVQSSNEYASTCVAYIDARDVQKKLDNDVGSFNWSCRYEEIKNNLFCHIGIYDGVREVWKSDCGTESNVEKQKGEASDSFKRAAVMWGIGRFLYDITPIKLESIKNTRGKWVASYNGKILYGDEITRACDFEFKKLNNEEN
jgi:hypothetical protein